MLTFVLALFINFPSEVLHDTVNYYVTMAMLCSTVTMSYPLVVGVHAKSVFFMCNGRQ